MIHNVFNFVENLVMHVDLPFHGGSPRFKLLQGGNEYDNCAFVRPERPGFPLG